MNTRNHWIGSAVIALAGALFGAGLVVAGMTRPAKVVGFLDVTGAWDPSLAFVMGGAILVHFAAHRLLLPAMGRPWFDTRFWLPTRTDFDVRLVAGSALFGLGWGLGGFCPGPALTSAGAGAPSALLFGVGMLGGMVLMNQMDRARQQRENPVALSAPRLDRG